MDRDRRLELLDRFERRTELPLLLLALAFVPLLIGPLLFDLSPGLNTAFNIGNWAIWAVFAVEYGTRLYLTPSGGRRRFVRREWLDLMIVVLPFLRPLRIVRSARALRLLRLGRVLPALGRAGQIGQRLLFRHKLHYALFVTGLVIIGAASAVVALEGAGDGGISGFGDALWWAVVTMTTVGYGDVFTTTPGGRGVAAFLMLAGIALFGIVTANIAAYFVGGDEDEMDDPRLVEVERKLDEVLARLEALQASSGGSERITPV